MAITTDFTVYPYSKTIRHTSSNDDVHTVLAFYSFLMDLFDEPGYMSYERPIKYNTPTSYTMLNGWFLDNGDGSNIFEYLYGGSIDTGGYANEIRMIDLDDGGGNWATFTSTDKDEEVTDDGTPVGPLLAYKNAYPSASTGRIWVRDTRVTPAAILDNSVIDVTGGDGSGDAKGADKSGDEIYTNIYTIASFAGSPNPQVYIKQLHPADATQYIRIAEWSNTDSWDRSATGIDVIIPVKLGGQLIDGGEVTAFVRQTGDTFTHVIADLSGGSRTPIATETQPDTINVTKGEWYLLFDASTGPSAFSAGDVIQNVSTANTTPPSWYAEVVSVTEFTVNTTGVLVLRALKGTPTDGDSIWVGTTDTADVVGTVGDTYLSYTSGTDPVPGDLDLPFEGSSSGAHRVLKGYDTAEKKLVMAVHHTHGTLDGVTYTGSNRDVLYQAFSSGELVDKPAAGSGAMAVTTDSVSTTLISGYSDITIAHINGTVTNDANNSTNFIMGEVVTYNAGANSAIIVAHTNNGGNGTITLANVDQGTEPDASDTLTGAISGATADLNSTMTDKYKEGFEFNLQSEGAEYAVFLEGGAIYETGRSLGDIYAYLQYRCRDGETADFYTSDGSSVTLEEGQFYIKAYSTYTALKAAPFGTLAGGVFFGAQGVWIQGMDSDDANNIKLTDNAGNAQEPYTSVVVTISNTRVGDDIVVFLEDGSTGLPDKTQYLCDNSNTKGDSTLVVSGVFPNDTPSTGAAYVVDNTNNEEHRYRYASWTGITLSLTPEVSGIAKATTTGQTLVDTGNFAAGVIRGDIVRRTSDDAWAYVISVDDNDTVTTTVLSDGTSWAQDDVYTMNTLVADYAATDTFFIPYLEAVEDTGTDVSPGSETEELTYVAPRAVVIRVRNVENANPIQPFVTTSDITAAGMTVSVIRNDDEVYS